MSKKIHFRQHGAPLCHSRPFLPSSFAMTDCIDDVTCAKCLKMLFGKKAYVCGCCGKTFLDGEHRFEFSTGPVWEIVEWPEDDERRAGARNWRTRKSSNRYFDLFVWPAECDEVSPIFLNKCWAVDALCQALTKMMEAE